jgi:hypothetical protein
MWGPKKGVTGDRIISQKKKKRDKKHTYPFNRINGFFDNQKVVNLWISSQNSSQPGV